jgi:indolepyruvate ferredoxin oxidoreductase alpha subunit
MDTCVCMGASIGIGLGMRHVLPEEQARKVVSVIGDSTFMHSGLTGIADMVYNRPKTGHLVIILDNGTTAMTGLQEHAGTGKYLDHTEAEGNVCIEDTLTAMGVDKVVIVDPAKEVEAYEQALDAALASNDLTVIICRRPCILARVRDTKLERGETVR